VGQRTWKNYVHLDAAVLTVESSHHEPHRLRAEWRTLNGETTNRWFVGQRPKRHDPRKARTPTLELSEEVDALVVAGAEAFLGPGSPIMFASCSVVPKTRHGQLHIAVGARRSR
jgi:hypothetical protein